MQNTIVFLGSSLPLAEAKVILPNAFYLPPVRCGDILRALRLQPKIIAIIDGLFERTAAVWHKEILFALERGVQIYGASSMGALRAAELADFGMQGIGKIFADYQQGLINDDDEVAILHGPEQSGFSPITDAMVNIRATLKSAIEEKIINEILANTIIDNAKKLFYRERTLINTIKVTSEQGNVDKIVLEHLQAWLKDNYIDQKKHDAITLLKTINTSSAVITSSPNIHHANRSTFFRLLYKNIMCRPFTHDNDDLPMHERVALAARYLGNTYLFTRRLAYLLSAVDALTTARLKISDNNIPADDIFDLQTVIDNQSWDQNNDCDNESPNKLRFIARMQRIEFYIAQSNRTYPHSNPATYYLLSLMRLAGIYTYYKKIIINNLGNIPEIGTQIIDIFKAQDPVKYRLMYYTAQLWRLIEIECDQANLAPNLLSIQSYSDKFRLQHKLHTQQATQQWLTENDLRLPDYHNLMAISVRFRFIVLQNNLDTLNVFQMDEEAWWLLEAMWLTGVYIEAKQLVINPEQKQQALQKLQAGLAANKDYADLLDINISDT